MQSNAATVDEYLAGLPEDRRRALNAVRKVILKNIDKQNIEEGMQYGMIGYYVPHRVYPPGYHCNPKEPLPVAGMASQKNHMSLYLMCVYGSDAEAKRFQQEWAKTGSKLDMGKSCIRFKTVDDLALDVIAATFKRITAKKYIEHYEGAIKPKPKAGPTEAVATKKKAVATKSSSKKVTRKAGTKVAKQSNKKVVNRVSR